MSAVASPSSSRYCGGGTDTVKADANDTVAADCDIVHRSGAHGHKPKPKKPKENQGKKPEKPENPGNGPKPGNGHHS